MLEKLIHRLCEEIALDRPKKSGNVYTLVFAKDIVIEMTDLSPGAALRAPIQEVPKAKREDLFCLLMRANLLGQGTGENRIGLDTQEKFLTLSLGLPYELNYKTFKDKLEDFINYLVYWKEEIATTVR